VREHERRGDKIIVFSDSIFVLDHFSAELGRESIQGSTPHAKRLEIFANFNRVGGHINTILVSKIGDNAIDLPSANIIIQVSSHFAARRQEAQRLGRILRPKAKSTEKYNAYFYTLVSKDTREMYYSSKRQRFLVEQGYAFKVINGLVDESTPGLKYEDAASRLTLLEKVKITQDKGALELEKVDASIDSGEVARQAAARAQREARGMAGMAGARRVGGSASALAGGDGAYDEFDAAGAQSVYNMSIKLSGVQARRLQEAKVKKNPVVRHSLFKKRYGK